MELENIGNQEHTFSSTNIDINLVENNIIQKNITKTEPNEKYIIKNKIILDNLKFGKNLLIWLLKKSKNKNRKRPHSTKMQKINNNSAQKNINRRQQNILSEKYKNIPRINKLQYLTEESINDLLKTEQDKSHFYSPTSTPMNLFSNNELKKKINRVYNSSFKANKKLSLKMAKKDTNKNSFLAITLRNKINHKKNNKQLFNTKLYYSISKEKIIANDFKNKNLNNKTNININNSNSYRKTIYKKRNTSEISKIKGYTHENILDKKKYFKKKFEIKEGNNININNDNKYIPKKNLKKNSKIDKLFKLEKPYEYFEEKVNTNKPEGKYIFFKNQIIKQKNKTIKMYYDYKKQLRENDTLITRYIYKLYSERNKNKL